MGKVKVSCEFCKKFEQGKCLAKKVFVDETKHRKCLKFVEDFGKVLQNMRKKEVANDLITHLE